MNDCVTKWWDVVVDELLNLKKFIEMQLPECTVIISEPVICTDAVVAVNNVREVSKILSCLNIYMLKPTTEINCNTEAKKLGKGGLHLNEHGTKRMAITFLQNF